MTRSILKVAARAALAVPVLASLASAAAAQDRELTIYTYDSFTADWGPGPIIKETFEAECGCELTWVAVADGVALLNRLKLEGDATRADIVLGLDTSLVADAKATGLFQPHGIDASVEVPGGFSDEVFLPYDYGHFAVVYDTEAMEPIGSLSDLIEGAGTEKIVIQDPRTSTPGLGLMLWIKAVYGDDAPEAWRKLSERVLTVTPGWSEAYGLFTQGEAPMVLSYVTSPAYHMVAEETDRYQAMEFAEGHYLQVEVAGMTTAAGDPGLAREFLEFMLTPGFQDAIPTANWMMPAGETSEALPEAFDKLVKPKTLFLDPEEVAAKRREWTDEWLAASTGR